MRILKRKKGTQTYLYIQHSFRKNGKVVTREKYLGNKIPRNIDKIKATLKRESQKEMLEKLERIRKNFQKEWQRYPESAKIREKEEIAIAFTYNTNAIEGSTITLNEVQEIIKDKISPAKPLKDIKETESHCRVFLEMLKEKKKITSELLLKWHTVIFSETKPDIAGKFRDYLVRVSNHIAPDWRSVNKLVSRLITFIKKAGMNPVELSARAHYRFEKIHPFGDGNGRIGRLLMNHILWHSGFPMVIVEYNKRKAYYSALERNEEGFVRFFIRTYIRIHKRWIR